MVTWADPNSVQNPTSGVTILSAWGDQVRNDLLVLAAPPAARARRSTNQTIPDTTDTEIAADDLDYDTHSIHSVVSGASRFTIPTGWGGVWEFKMNTNWESNVTGERRCHIWVNGSPLAIANDISAPSTSGGLCAQNISTEWDAVVGDYFEFLVWQDTGSALNLEPVDYAAQTISAKWVRITTATAA